MSNLHLTLGPFRNASRILKETDAIIKNRLADDVIIVALHERGLAEHDKIDNYRRVWRVKLKTRHLPNNLLCQLIKFTELCWLILFFAKRKRTSIVNVHHLALLPVGALIKLLMNAKLVYDPHELETERNGLAGFRKTGAKLIERFLITHCDLVVVVGGAIRDWYQGAYGISNVAVVLNAPPYRALEPTDVLRHVRGISNQRVICIYQGILTSGRGIEELVSAFECMKDEQYELVFMGSGPLEQNVLEATKRSEKIHHIPAVPTELVLAYTASANVGISCIADVCLSYRLCLPNKLFEYIMARIPVIVSDLPEMKAVVESFDIGVTVSEITQETIMNALVAISVKTEGLSERLEQAAKHYCWERQEETMVSYYHTHVLNK